jgi:ankyrin repeat protein
MWSLNASPDHFLVVPGRSNYPILLSVLNLNAHSAALNGNLGLLEYALTHGQPVNSVLDGLLPLHTACAGGNEQVVKLLIEYGADVNTPRFI